MRITIAGTETPPRINAGSGSIGAGASFAAAMQTSVAVTDTPAPRETAIVVPASLLLSDAVADGRARRDRDARRRAAELVALLSCLQRATLGNDQERSEVLARIAGALVSLPASDDPVLVAMTREIELRARVELARAGR